MLSRKVGLELYRAARSSAFRGSNAVRYLSSKPEKSILGSANVYFSNLRWKAANALASSLPEEERHRLLEKFEPEKATKDNDVKVEEERSVPARSIDEIVAEARAKEAEAQKKQWETAKDKFRKEAEEAARKRVESDLTLQQHRLKYAAWEMELEQAKKKEAAGGKQEIASSSVDEHPILGPVLVDLGSKRIHVAKADALSAIPVWKKQRHYDYSRAKAMASDKMKTLHLGLPGIIGVYENSDGGLSIVDGQHRVGMLKELQSRNPDNFDFDRILVEVYPQPDGMDQDAHAAEIFVEVNKALPVKQVDQPGVKASDKKIIDESATILKDRFPEMFSESANCRKPHLNLDNLRESLFISNIIDRHSISTTKQMKDWILRQNEAMKSKFQVKSNQEFVPANALKKAQKYDFYLGLGADWLDG
eukprot:scaffold10187_cov195-Cylindrotheca_fusiformis.AAC.3